MENPFEIIQGRLSAKIEEAEKRILEGLELIQKAAPGIELDRYISQKKVAEMYGISTQTLRLHSHEIEHVKRFGQVYFLKSSLASYMEAGRPEKKTKAVMTTGRKNSIVNSL